MTRRILNLLSALSLLVCAAAVTLWVRSYWRADHFSRDTISLHAAVTTDLSAMGGTLFYFSHRQALETRQATVMAHLRPPRPPWTRTSTHTTPAVAATDRRRSETRRDIPGRVVLGFSVRRLVRLKRYSPDGTLDEGTTLQVGVPCWSVATAAALLPGVRVYRRLRTRRRTRAGLCQQCGYDLRATPGRCPECGAAPVSSARGVTLECPKVV